MSMSAGSKKLKCDINVTPMVDVCLVLLIIFMVVTPMLKEGVAVQLPETEHGVQIQEDKKENVVLTIKDDGSLYIENVQIHNVEEDNPASNRALEDAIRAALQQGKNKPLLIKADSRMEYGKVKRVMEVVKDADILKSVVLAADVVEKDEG